jgi:hypothetical protein
MRLKDSRIHEIVKDEMKLVNAYDVETAAQRNETAFGVLKNELTVRFVNPHLTAAVLGDEFLSS